jgi:hypothetical protein
MASVVLELQRDALDQKVPVVALLRKALVVARKLSLVEFQSWIESELNGYRGASESIPDYREVNGTVKAWNPYQGWVPVLIHDAEHASWLCHRKIAQSISELEDLHNAQPGKGSALHMPFPAQAQAAICQAIGTTTEVALVVPATAITRVLDAVRTVILNWSLKLEEDGVIGEGLSFTFAEKEHARTDGFNVTNFYGPVQSPQIQQGVQHAVQVSITVDVDPQEVQEYLARLQNEIGRLGLTPEARAEAEAEIVSVDAQTRSPRPKMTIVREGLQSLRTILEGATGSAAGQLLIELGKLLASSQLH